MHIAARDSVLIAGVVVHFGQAFGAVFIGHLVNPVEDTVDLGLDQKATGADALGGIAKGIQSQQFDTLAGKKGDIAFHQSVGQFRFVIQIDLLLGEGTPHAGGVAVGERHFAKRFLLFADMNLRHIVRADVAKLVDVDKQLRVFGIEALGNEVGELRRFVGDVVDRQVHAEIVFR